MNKANEAVAWRLDEAAPGHMPGLFMDFDNTEGPAADVEIRHMFARRERLSSFDARSQLQQKKVAPNTGPARPTPEINPLYPGAPEAPYGHLADKRFAFVGYGAGTVIMASYFAARGVNPSSMTIIDPHLRGGLWRQDWVQGGGFNNPKALAFYGHQLELDDRGGRKMLDYLIRIGADHLGPNIPRPARRTHDTVTAVEKGRKDDAWRLQTSSGATHEADFVVLATGTPRPRRIDGARMYSNLDEVAASPHYSDSVIKIERHQRELTDEDFVSRRPLVIMGLGNSTASMLRQIQAYEDKTGRVVDYTVVTDWSQNAVMNPSVAIERGKSIFRNPPKGYLTGYSGDLPADNRAYKRAVLEGHVLSDVHSVYLDSSGELVVGTKRYSEMRCLKAHVFALLGYERDDRLFRTAGALTQGWLRKEVEYPDIRPCDGAVRTQRDGYMSNLFAVGAVAAGPGNLAAATVPGIQGQAPETMLTIAARSYAESRKRSRQTTLGRLVAVR